MTFKNNSTNRIDNLFREKDNNILSVYFTAGFPELESVPAVLKILQDTGVDMVEIGIPFSDPVADGETIQRSSQQALDNGMTLIRLFEQLQNVRETIEIPLVLMSYLNPIYQYGMEAFCKSARSAGIDGLIIPDLPTVELETSYKELFESYNLKNVLLITPQTSVKRIKKLDNLSMGFNYLVSSSSTTGKTSGFNENQIAYFKRIENMDLANPSIVGFGVSSARDFKIACKYSNGAIIGSALIKAMMKSGSLENNIRTFISGIKQ